MVIFIARILFPLLLGLLPAFALLQYNSHVQRALCTKLISVLEKMWKAKIEVKKSTIDVFSGKIFFEHGEVTSVGRDDHGWHFDECRVEISRLGLLFNNRIDINLGFSKLKAKTLVRDNRLTIIDHIKNIFDTPKTEPPLKLCNITAQEFSLAIIQGKESTLIEGAAHLFLKKTNYDEGWAGSVGIKNGTVSINDFSRITSLTGATNLRYHSPTSTWNAQTDYEFFVANKKAVSQYTLEINSTNELHKCKLHKKDLTFLINACVDKDKALLDGHFNLDELQSMYALLPSSKSTPFIDIFALAGGTAQFQTAVHFTPYLHSEGKIDLSNIPAAQLGKGILQATFKQTEKNIQASVVAQTSQKIMLKGKVLWDLQHQRGTANVQNASPINISSLANFQVQALNVDLNYSLKDGLKGTYSLSDKQAPHKKHALLGSLFTTGNTVHLTGNSGKKNYHFAFDINRRLLSRAELKEGKKTSIHLALNEDTKLLCGHMHSSFLRSLFPYSIRPHILGNTGHCEISINQKELPIITGSFNFAHGNLHLLGGVNLFTNGSSSFHIDPLQRQLYLKDLVFNLYKGKIESPYLKIQLDESYSPSYLHIPLKINDTLINWKQDMYALIYGNLLIKKQSKTPLHVSGHIVLKKSLLKENIFSQSLNTASYIPPFSIAPKAKNASIDIFIQTQNPLHIQTPFLNAQSHLDIHLNMARQGHQFSSPRLNGKIRLTRGSLNFTRNKLLIKNATLRFVPNQVNDMYLDLTAQNKIKKYWITLTAQGNVQKPTISLEASPMLSEEQILALLFAGSENTSLQTDFPQIVMQNLHQVILGSKQVLPQATSFFQTITKPLRYIQITPNFSDQSYRGGVRGTVSIDVNKQLHAQIQKNFNLQEDFAFQVEYFLSDDLSFKLIKDQRGELGAGVEVRMKV